MAIPTALSLFRYAAWALALGCACAFAWADESDHDHAHDHGRIYPGPVEMETADAAKLQEQLPPLPAGVAELRFRDLFRMPVGERGLEFSEVAQGLAGRRVRILGYMVREDQPVPGRLLLAPFPFTLLTTEYGPCEDLPATVVHVHASSDLAQPVPFTPGLLLLTGVLDLGNRDEPDGRISAVRLRLDAPEPAAAAGPVPLAASSDHS